jgi:hypothetical protein
MTTPADPDPSASSSGSPPSRGPTAPGAGSTETSTAGIRSIGADKFTLRGDRTEITYFPTTPGPIIAGHEGGQLTYQGPDGDITVYGAQINRADGPAGSVLTSCSSPTTTPITVC